MPSIKLLLFIVDTHSSPNSKHTNIEIITIETEPRPRLECKLTTHHCSIMKVVYTEKIFNNINVFKKNSIFFTDSICKKKKSEIGT